MQIYDRNEEGNILLIFDSRWADPRDVGIDPDDPLYHELKAIYEAYKARKDRDHGQR